MSQDGSAGLWSRHPFYARVNVGGLLVYAFFFTVVGVIFELSQPGSIVFTAVLAVPALVIALLALRVGGWGLTLSSVWAVLMLLLALVFLLPSLSYVTSFWDFGATLVVIVALLAATVGGVVSFVQRRRGTVRQTATTAERRWLVGASGVVVGLAALSGVLHIVSIESVPAEAKSDAIAVAMNNTRFEPAEITVQSGRPATLVVKNQDLSVHTFTVEALGISEVIIGGSEQLITIASSSPGSFEFVCEIPGHEEMSGTLVVQVAAQ